MTETVHLFYIYVLPIMILFSFVYIIFQQTLKKTYFENIEQNFFSTIEKNKRESTEALQKHFEFLKSGNKEALEMLDHDARTNLQETLIKFEEMNKAQKELTFQLQNQQQYIEEFISKSKIKDSVIDQKNKQIKRLKNEIPNR